MPKKNKSRLDLLALMARKAPEMPENFVTAAPADEDPVSTQARWSAEWAKQTIAELCEPETRFEQTESQQIKLKIVADEISAHIGEAVIPDDPNQALRAYAGIVPNSVTVSFPSDVSDFSDYFEKVRNRSRELFAGDLGDGGNKARDTGEAFIWGSVRSGRETDRPDSDHHVKGQFQFVENAARTDAVDPAKLPQPPEGRVCPSECRNSGVCGQFDDLRLLYDLSHRHFLQASTLKPAFQLNAHCIFEIGDAENVANELSADADEQMSGRFVVIRIGDQPASFQENICAMLRIEQW